MPTYYTDEEIDALVNDVKQAFLEPAFQLAKSEGKVYPTAKEGGNGVQTQSEHGLQQSAPINERADTMKQGQPSKSGKGTPSLMSKAAPPSESPESEPSAPAESAPSEPSADAGAPAPASADSAPAPGGAPEMGAPDAGGAGGAEQQNGPDEIKSAYESLDDQSLQLHLQIAAGVLKERMGQQQGAGAGAPPAGGPDASAGAPPAGPAAGAGGPPPDMGAPAPAPDQAPPGMVKAEELSKAQNEIKKLSKAVETVTEMFIKMTSQPKPKAITEMSELNKSETSPKATRDQVDAKLMNKAREPNLLKSDRTLIARYFTPNNKVKFEEIEHLLK